VHFFADKSLYERFFSATLKMARDTGLTAERIEGMTNTFLDLGDTYAVYAGKDSFLTQAKGVFTRSQIRRLKGFYAAHGCSWEAILSPFAGNEALQNVIDAGGKVEQWETVLFRPAGDPILDHPLPANAEIRLVEGVDACIYTEVMRKGFFGDDPNPMLEQMGRIYENVPNTRRYIAFVDGVPSAGAALAIVDRTAYFSGAATLPEFRGRGLQNALISQRLKVAQDLADLVTFGSSPGSGSQRNAERHGFRLAYNQLSLRVAP